MDRLIFQDMLACVDLGVQEKLKNNNLHYTRFMNQLAELAVKAKHHLTVAEVFEENIQIGFDMIPYRLTVEKFNEMIAPLVGQTSQICRKAIAAAGLETSKLSAILMVGGTSRIPLVQEMAHNVSDTAKVLRMENLELAVTQGALEYQRYVSRKIISSVQIEQGGTKRISAEDIEKLDEDSVDTYYNGNKAYKNGIYKDAVEWYQKAAKLGYSHAMYMLGCCFQGRKDVQGNKEWSIEYFRKAAELEDIDAMVRMGWIYEHGLMNMPKNEEKSHQWYQKAAEAGNRYSANHLKTRNQILRTRTIHDNTKPEKILRQYWKEIFQKWTGSR